MFKRIRDLGRSFCGVDFWQDGPASLPPGLFCPDPKIPFVSDTRNLESKSKAAGRIFGGQVVDRLTTWPWIVDLESCAGSIITKNPTGQNDWILTGQNYY